MGLKMEIRKLSEQFSRHGYVVIDHFVSTDVCKKITSDAKLMELSGDLKKVKLLTALIYLNISKFYDSPYSELLFFHGKYQLYKLT